MSIAKALRRLPGRLPMGGVVAVLVASLFGVQQAAAQTCQPEKLYDIIVSSFHQSAAQRTDGSWAGWGQTMGVTGLYNSPNATYAGQSVPRPMDIGPGGTWANGQTGLTGYPLLMAVGSTSNTEQTIALTSAGLHAWGTVGAVLNTANKSTTPAGIITVADGTAKGLPLNVEPEDVAQMFATNKLLALVTKSGQAWVLVNSSLTDGARLQGDGFASGAGDNKWHRVKTDAATNLANVVAIRGQVGGNSRGALMAQTSGGKLYAWGSTPYLGNALGVPTSTGYALPMTLPQESGADITPKMIGVTGNGTSANNTMFVLSTTGTLYSVGANSQRQLGANLTTAAETSWQTVAAKAADGSTNVSLMGKVAFFSVQEHDAGSAAGALITTDDLVYTWGSNNGDMIARRNTQGGTDLVNGSFHVGEPRSIATYNPDGSASTYVLGTGKVRLVEVGGHTTVLLPKSSPQFCYVGHQIRGSMGDGVITDNYQYGFNCKATPVLNICGASGFDYGDAPKGYENGGGSNQAMHFYANGGDDPNNNPLFLGAKAPQKNDDNPKNVVSGTKNVGEYGDYIASPAVILEEDGITETYALVGGAGSWTAVTTPGDELPTILDTTTEYSLKVRYTNTTQVSGGTYVAGTIHAWVDWNNDGVFQASEYTSAVAVANTTDGEAVLSWTGLSNLDEGYRYIRLRITTATAVDLVNNPQDYNKSFPAANVTIRTNEDARALGFALDGEMEDHRVRVMKSGGADNVRPVAVDVTTAPVGLGTTPVRLLLPNTSTAAPMDGTDSDGTVVAYRIMSLPTNGTLYYLDGSLPVAITSIPTGGLAVEATTELWYSGTDPAAAVFTFKAIDDDSDESDNTAMYTIPKVLIDAVNDTATAALGTASIATNVVGNDKSETYDAAGTVTGSPAYTVTSSTNGTKGTVSCTAAGVCTYTPTNPNTAGSDSYEYTICLTAAPTVCDTATVTVTLSPLTITPVNDVTNTPPDVPVDIPVLQNDRGDTPLDPASVTIMGTPPTKGNVTCDATTGVCTYVPTAGQTGTDTFTYQVCLAAPNGGVCSTATVTVNISATGVVATDDVTNTPLNTAKTIPVVQNDTATGGTIDPASVTKTSEPAHGSVNCSAGACVYTPNNNFTGTDTFTYKVCLAAPDAAVCDEAQVTVTVGSNGVVATDDVTNTPEGTATTIPVTQNDTTTGGGVIDPASAAKTSDPAHGVVNCANGQCVYTPDAGYTGTDTFTYKVCLAAPNAAVCDEAQVTVTVTAAGGPGVSAADDVTNTPLNTATTIPVTQNDTTTGGGVIDPASVAKTSDPAHGVVNCANGQCVYTPDAGYTGTDTFTYKVCLAAPNAAVCDEAQVTVTVTAAGGPGVDATDDTANTTAGAAVNVPVTTNDVVTGGGTIDLGSAVVTSGPGNGTVVCGATPGVCRYTSNPGFTGPDQFTYKVCLAAPNAAVCDEAVVRVQVAAAAPVGPAAIPTLSEWGVIILSALMALAGLARRRRV